MWFDILVLGLNLLEFLGVDDVRHVQVVVSAHRQDVLSVKIIHGSFLLHTLLGKLFQNVRDPVGSTDRHCLLEEFGVNELLLRIDSILLLKKRLKVIQVLEDSVGWGFLVDLLHLLLNVAECLLGHHSVITLVNWHWTIVVVLLWQVGPCGVAGTATVYSHALDAVICHLRVE